MALKSKLSRLLVAGNFAALIRRLNDTTLAEAIELSHSLQYETGEDGSYTGLAWFTQDMDNYVVTWHNGGTAGFRTFLGFDAENKRGVIVLENSQDQTDLIGHSILTGKPETLEPDEADALLELTAEQLERIVGDYQLAPEFVISITREADQLFLQATGQPRIPLYAEAELEFVLKVVDASIVFEENDSGEITRLILDQGGVEQPASKL